MERLPEHWKDEFNTGNKFIDEQHRYFYNIVKELENSVEKNDCMKKISDIFFSLVHYVEKYMLEEEIYLKDLNYDGLDEHKRSHRQFITGVTDFKDDFASGEEGVCMKLLDFLHGWWNDHILRKDNKVIDSLSSGGIH